MVSSLGWRVVKRFRLRPLLVGLGVASLIVVLAAAAPLSRGVASASPLLGRSAFSVTATSGPVVTDDASPVTVEVDGNHLVNAQGATVRLMGVDRSGTEYACEQGWGIFDGPSDATSVAAMASWHIDAVRIPLNEGCWLDQFTAANDPYLVPGGDPTPYEGGAYQSAIAQYVDLLHQYGMVAILDLAVLNVPAPDAMNVLPMPDAANAPTFWQSVASYFEDDPGVVFDLYNEPNPGSSGSYPYDTTSDWACWLNGCTVPWQGTNYAAVGMKSLVDTVRATGATQPILLGSVDYAGDYGLNGSGDDSGWLTYESEIDPTHTDGIIADLHTYSCESSADAGGGCNGDSDYNAYCITATCWQDMIAPLSEVVPVVTAEFGDYVCDPNYLDSYMQFADEHGISYLAWTWDATDSDGGDSWTCDNPSVIEDYDGTPTAEGAALQSHLAQLASPLTIETTSIPAALRKLPYKATFTAFGGDPPYRWSLVKGALPVGVHLSSTGVLSGTPTTNQTASFTVKVVDTASTTHAQESATAAFMLSVTQPAPTVTSVRPASGPVVGGTKVTITGTALESASDVLFGSVPALRFAVNAAGTSIVATAPAAAAGEVLVTVTTPGGTSATGSGTAYTYRLPAITQVYPASGPAAGGTPVVVRGTNLNGATVVSFGSVAAGAFTVNAAGTMITTRTPPGSDGVVTVVVTTPGGSSPAGTAARFTYKG